MKRTPKRYQDPFFLGGGGGGGGLQFFFLYQFLQNMHIISRVIFFQLNTLEP